MLKRRACIDPVKNCSERLLEKEGCGSLRRVETEKGASDLVPRIRGKI